MGVDTAAGDLRLWSWIGSWGMLGLRLYGRRIRPPLFIAVHDGDFDIGQTIKNFLSVLFIRSI
jgi:hypothetical protein